MIHRILDNVKVVLASASPRRQQLISMMGIKPLVVPPFTVETNSGTSPRAQALNNARLKAESVAGTLDAESLVIGADTIVVLDERIIGKPKDASEAKAFLSLLSETTHQVYTGICTVYQGRVHQTYEKSSVTFARLSNAEIEAYIQTGEPMDKAGAYGIQGYGAQFISGIEGCYFNVMGFPIHRFYQLLREMMA